MNCDTGILREISKDLALEKALESREVMVPVEDLTEKQKKEMKVSLQDNRSNAGKKRVEYVKKNPLTKNQRRNQRNKLKKKN